MKKYINFISQKLRLKYRCGSHWQVIAIFTTFSLAGTTVVIIRPWFFQWVGMNEQTPWWWKSLAYIVFVFPTYQVLLLIYGSLLGQYRFFAHKTKRLVPARIVTLKKNVS